MGILGYMNADKFAKPLSGTLTKRILLVLMAGISLGLTRSPRQYFRIIKSFRREWEALGVESRHLPRTLQNLKKKEWIKMKKGKDGYWYPELTEKGRWLAMLHQIEDLRVEIPAKWDGRWRMVLFDIPEHRKKARDAFSRTLKQLGFVQFQKSIFLHPADCRKEIDFVIDFFSLKPYVKFAVLESLEGDRQLKKHFKI